METITIIQRHECLPFSDLDEDVQEKVMEKYGDWNVDCDWWDGVYSWFEELCQSYGVGVDAVYFSGFGSQGDGAAFAGAVTDIDKFLEHFDKTRKPGNARAQAMPAARHALRLLHHMRSEGLRLVACPTGRHGVAQSYEFDRHGMNPHEGHTRQERLYKAAEMVLDTLESIWEDACTDLAHDLYRSLEKEYDYLTSPEALSESFDANQCLFDVETGELFHREQNANAA